MEAVARQFATDNHVMVLRNGWFSYRWTEIFDMGGEGKSIPSSHTSSEPDQTFKHAVVALLLPQYAALDRASHVTRLDQLSDDLRHLELRVLSQGRHGRQCSA